MSPRRKTPEPHELREILRQAIVNSGQTVYQIAKATGLDQSQIHRFLRDERQLKLESAEVLCEHLGLGLLSTAH